MSKTIYIGDIHGRDVWAEIVAKHDDADNIVFIGDYFDSFDIPAVIQLDNITVLFSSYLRWMQIPISFSGSRQVAKHFHASASTARSTGAPGSRRGFRAAAR